MIVVAGEALVDLVIEPSGEVTAVLGGAPFNTARTCGRLGMSVSFVGAVSIDRFGSMLRDQLAADGVAIDRLVAVDVPTTLAAAELDENGAASYRFYIDGTSAPALEGASIGSSTTALFTGGLALVLEPMADTIETMVRRAPDECVVMVDINCRPLVVRDRLHYLNRVERVLERADVVKVSDDDLAYLSPDLDHRDAAHAVLKRGPKAVLLTAGGGSTSVITAQGMTEVPVRPVEVIDTIGAGDSFGGGFLSWWSLAGYGRKKLSDVDLLARAVNAANDVAGVVVTRRGADPPWRSELPAGWMS